MSETRVADRAIYFYGNKDMAAIVTDTHDDGTIDLTVFVPPDHESDIGNFMFIDRCEVTIVRVPGMCRLIY